MIESRLVVDLLISVIGCELDIRCRDEIGCGLVREVIGCGLVDIRDTDVIGCDLDDIRDRDAIGCGLVDIR